MSQFYRDTSAAPYRIVVSLSKEDRESLKRLTFAKRQTASDVVRELLRLAAASLPFAEDEEE